MSKDHGVQRRAIIANITIYHLKMIHKAFKIDKWSHTYHYPQEQLFPLLTA